MPFFCQRVSMYGAVVTVGMGPGTLSILAVGIFDHTCFGRIGIATFSRNSESRVVRCSTNVFASGADTDFTAEIVVCSWLVLFCSTALNVYTASALVNGWPSDQWMPVRRWKVIVLPSFETSAPDASELL